MTVCFAIQPAFGVKSHRFRSRRDGEAAKRVSSRMCDKGFPLSKFKTNVSEVTSGAPASPEPISPVHLHPLELQLLVNRRCQ
jgi:hypothetical protein